MAWRLISHNVHNIVESMAIDEAIFLYTVKNRSSPTLRFYSTDPKAISLGYFQEPGKEIAVETCRREGVDIVRRITGGKAVFHFQEITYCVAAAASERLFPENIAGTYKVISEAIARGLDYLGVHACLADGIRKNCSRRFNSFCFSASSQNELLVDGKKICGSAQIRKKSGFLQHGSLLVSFDAHKTASFLLPARSSGEIEDIKKSVTALGEHLREPLASSEICSILQKGFINQLGIELKEGKLTAEEERLKKCLIEKYLSAQWTMERKHKKPLG